MSSWFVFASTAVFVIWGIIAPSSAAQFVQSLFLVAMRPVVVLQNGIAAGIAYLRGVIDRLGGQLGGPVRILGALVQLLVFFLLTSSGFYLTVLSLAGILGQDSTLQLPASLEILTGGSLVLGIAYLIGVLLELGGMLHFGCWNDLPPRLRKVLMWSVVGLVALGVWTSIQLGYARAELESITSEDLLHAAAGHEEPTDSSVQQVLILLPLFIDFTAALAFWGAVSGVIVLFAALVLAAQFILALLNLAPTVAIQVLDALREAAQAVFRLLADIGEALGLSTEQVAAARTHADGQETDLPASPVPAVAAHHDHNDGNRNTPQGQAGDGLWHDPPHDPPDALEPELMPIEEEQLDPLGIGNNRRND